MTQTIYQIFAEYELYDWTLKITKNYPIFHDFKYDLGNWEEEYPFNKFIIT